MEVTQMPDSLNTFILMVEQLKAARLRQAKEEKPAKPKKPRKQKKS
jgi:hypothetical protein